MKTTLQFLDKVRSLFVLSNKWATAFVMSVVFLLSAAVLWGLHSNLERIEESRLQSEMIRLKGVIGDRIDSQINSLNAVRGLFSLSGEPQPKQFQFFVSSILAGQQKQAKTLIGYTKYFPKTQGTHFEAQLRKLVLGSRKIWPRAHEGHAGVITLVQPLNEESKSSVGFDMFSDVSSRDAMLASIETGSTTLSKPVSDVLEPLSPKKRLYAFVPYFGKGNLVPESVEMRRRTIQGFLYTPISLEGFFNFTQKGSRTLGHKINFAIDMKEAGSDQPISIYSRFPMNGLTKDSLVKENTFDVKNQSWTIRASPIESLLTPSEQQLIWVAWASTLILISTVIYIVKKTQLFIAEEERRKKLLMEATLAKSSFLANMSHEIRTPLGAIVGFTDLICKEDIAKEQREKFVSGIENNVQLLARIIDDVLDHSRLEAGKLSIEKRELSLPTLLLDIESVMNFHAQKKENLKFQIHCRGKIPSHIITDEVRVKQILTNLIDNAIKFTSKGEVTLTVQCPINPLHNKRYLEFLVEDTGIGIPQEMQKRLFEGFVQADPTTTRMYGGTGLGLALSKKLAHLLGGDIQLVKSFPGKGTLFRVILQIETNKEIDWISEWRAVVDSPAVKADLDQQESIIKDKKILLVEDSLDNQEIFRIFLESAGAQLQIVGNGIEAVETSKKLSYDLILMDIQIPGIDGKEATRQIRSHGYKGPIVALTAHAMPNEIESCIESGCNGQITKPVTGERLIRETEAYL